MRLESLLPIGATLSLFLAAAPLPAAETYVVDKGHSEAGFKVRHLVSKTAGRFADFSGRIQVDPAKPEASTVEFTIQAASIDTNEPSRDKHLKGADFFDVQKYPEITFRSQRVKPAGKDRYEVIGDLTMHGVTKTITLPVSFGGFVKDPWGGERAGFETELTLNRKDFGIVYNKVLDNGGTILGDDVQVAINIEAVKEKEKSAAK